MKRIFFFALAFATLWACSSPEEANNTEAEQPTVPEVTENDSQEELKADIVARALVLCKHLPGSVYTDYESFMTSEFLDLYKEALAVPSYTLDIPPNEFLYEMVQYGEFKPEFFITEDDVTIVNDNLAKVNVEARFEDGNYIQKSLLTIEKVDDQWFTADFDDTKHMCKEFIESEREMFKSGQAEESFRSEGASDEQIDYFNMELEKFYEQFGK